MTVFSNVVKESKLREVQLATLKLVKEVLSNSFGPMGSNTVIKKDNVATQYTKDGHTILSNLHLNGSIESTVVDELCDLTRHIVKEVGDGTTSAVILSSLIFEKLCEMKTEGMLPADIIKNFQDRVDLICEKIKANGKSATIDDIYNIALISTNNNIEVAQNIKTIYEEYGLNVFIDVGISNTQDNLVKAYDGMTLETGYSDSCYVNNKDGSSRIRNARIYVFEDPIDTPEMIGLFESIVYSNIYGPMSGDERFTEVVPTVVMAPKLTRDLTTYMDRLVEFMYKASIDNRPPFLLITNIYQVDQFMDIAMLCKAKLIKKYIDPNLQQRDIENGSAPTPETVAGFYGMADLVEADAIKTKFINPLGMYKDESKTEYSDTFNALLNQLEAELKVAYENNEDANVTGTLKRRINSLKANMVDFLIGGVTVADRDALRDLVEDAVLCCRSAVKNGVGYGANYEAFKVLSELYDGKDVFLSTLYQSYSEIECLLYSSIGLDDVDVDRSLNEGCPINLRTKEYDHKVLTSISSDITILETISKIVTLMFTSNQFLVQTPLDNKYMDKEDLN